MHGHSAPTNNVAMRDTAQRAVWFFVWSLAFALSLGATLGTLLWLSLTLRLDLLGPLAAKPVRLAHAYAQVFGFAALFVCGVAYHVLPRFSRRSWQPGVWQRWTLYGLVLGTAVASSTALWSPSRESLWLAHVCLAAGSGAFGWSVAMHLRSALLPPPLAAYLQWGCFWLVVAAALPLARPDFLLAAHGFVWNAALWGFASSWIYGMSLRILPASLGLPWQSARFDWLVLALHQAGVATWCLGDWRAQAALPGEAQPWLQAGGVLLALAALFYAHRLGFFSRMRAPVAHPIAGTEKFLWSAYAWLAVALLTGPLAVALFGAPTVGPAADFALHAFTVGFLAQMIVGVSMRVLPTAAGIPIWSEPLRDLTYWLLNCGALLRVGEALSAWGASLRWYSLAAAAGPVAWCAFVAFAVNLVLTMRQARTAT